MKRSALHQRPRRTKLQGRPRFPHSAVAGLVAVLLACTLVPVAVATRADNDSGTAVSAFEETLLGKINAARRKAGLRPLRIEKGLTTSAKAHARSMANDGYFAHASSDGTSASSRISRHYDGHAIGETMLWRSPDIAPAAAVQMWLASSPHRAVLLSGRFRDIGLAAIHLQQGSGSFGSRPVTIVVADFGAP